MKKNEVPALGVTMSSIIELLCTQYNSAEINIDASKHSVYLRVQPSFKDYGSIIGHGGGTIRALEEIFSKLTDDCGRSGVIYIGDPKEVPEDDQYIETDFGHIAELTNVMASTVADVEDVEVLFLADDYAIIEIAFIGDIDRSESVKVEKIVKSVFKLNGYNAQVSWTRI